jgi:hypothetical protein
MNFIEQFKMNNIRFNLKSSLILSAASFFILVFIFSGLPALLLLLNIPSLAIGDDRFWILRQKNEADSSGITFNPIPLFVAVLLVNLFVFYPAIARSSLTNHFDYQKIDRFLLGHLKFACLSQNSTYALF